MAFRDMDEVEIIASHFLKLKWKDMKAIASYFSTMEIDGSETADDWAQLIFDWADGTVENYNSEAG